MAISLHLSPQRTAVILEKGDHAHACGVSEYVTRLIDEAARRGWRVFRLSFSSPDDLSYHRYPLLDRTRLRKAFTIARRLLSLSPAVLVANWTPEAFGRIGFSYAFLLLLLRVGRRNVCLILHEAVTSRRHGFSGSVTRALQRAATGLAVLSSTRCVSPAPDVRASLPKILQRQILVAPFGTLVPQLSDLQLHARFPSPKPLLGLFPSPVTSATHVALLGASRLGWDVVIIGDDRGSEIANQIATLAEELGVVTIHETGRVESYAFATHIANCSAVAICRSSPPSPRRSTIVNSLALGVPTLVIWPSPRPATWGDYFCGAYLPHYAIAGSLKEVQWLMSHLPLTGPYQREHAVLQFDRLALWRSHYAAVFA